MGYVVPEPFRPGSKNHRARSNPCSWQWSFSSIFIVPCVLAEFQWGQKYSFAPTASSQWGQAAPTALRWRRPWSTGLYHPARQQALSRMTNQVGVKRKADQKNCRGPPLPAQNSCYISASHRLRHCISQTPRCMHIAQCC